MGDRRAAEGRAPPRSTREVGGDERMRQAVIGMLAHVDAGKTTLAEAMLLDAGADLVGVLAHQRALLGRDLAHRAQHARERALLARDRHADLVQLVKRRGLRDPLGRLLLDELEVIDQRHSVPLPKQKAVPEPNCPRTANDRGTTLIDARAFSLASAHSLAPFRGADGFPTCAFPAEKGVEVAAGGVNPVRQTRWEPLSRWAPSLSPANATRRASPSLPAG